MDPQIYTYSYGGPGCTSQFYGKLRMVYYIVDIQYRPKKPIEDNLWELDKLITWNIS